ncbi:MAG: flagellar brake protein [Desulfatiglandales bacterium]
MTIRLGGSDSAYTSYLLKIASIGRERQIYSDGLIPEEGNELIKESRDLQVSFVLREDEFMQRSVPYEFRTVFIREIIKSGPRQIVIRFPNELQRRQRRDYLRVSPPEGAPAFIKVDIQGKDHRFKVWDISGGGVAFLTDLNDNVMKVGTELRDVQIEIPGMPIIRCVSVVHKKVKLRGVYMEEKQHTTYICGCVFKEIDEEDRQLIIKYVVSVERERLRRLKASPASIDKEE